MNNNKTIFIPKHGIYKSLMIYFELREIRFLTDKEINNVLKVLNRPGYLNGIQEIGIMRCMIVDKSYFKIMNKIKGNQIKAANVTLLPVKEISFYERGVERGYTLHERYPL